MFQNKQYRMKAQQTFDLQKFLRGQEIQKRNREAEEARIQKEIERLFKNK